MYVIYQYLPLVVTMTKSGSNERAINYMLGWPMYIQIQQYKELGLKRSQVARRLGVDARTVSTYWTKTPEEMVEMQNRKRNSKYANYEAIILEWLRKYPDLSSSQVHDWLKENTGFVRIYQNIKNNNSFTSCIISNHQNFI